MAPITSRGATVAPSLCGGQSPHLPRDHEQRASGIKHRAGLVYWGVENVGHPRCPSSDSMYLYSLTLSGFSLRHWAHDSCVRM